MSDSMIPQVGESLVERNKDIGNVGDVPEDQEGDTNTVSDTTADMSVEDGVANSKEDNSAQKETEEA